MCADTFVFNARYSVWWWLFKCWNMLVVLLLVLSDLLHSKHFATWSLTGTKCFHAGLVFFTMSKTALTLSTLVNHKFRNSWRHNRPVMYKNACNIKHAVFCLNSYYIYDHARFHRFAYTLSLGYLICIWERNFRSKYSQSHIYWMQHITYPHVHELVWLLCLVKTSDWMLCWYTTSNLNYTS